jgi:hypothetical protein
MQLLTKIVSLHLILIKQPCLFSDTFNRLYEIDKNGKFYSWFVPTMGALHQGHLALMQQSLLEWKYCCKYFVNLTLSKKT